MSDPQAHPPLESSTTPTDEPEVAAEPAPKQQDTTPDSAPVIQSCTFFKLSGELRNRIYRYALVEPEPVTFEISGYNTSVLGVRLLGTCKMIRAEAIAIFHLENKFFHSVMRCDSRPLVRSRLQAKKAISSPRYLRIQVHPEPCWVNLVTWLENYHGGYCRAADFIHDETEAEVTVLNAIFEVVDVLRAQPWALVKRVVEAHRSPLIKLKSGWENDD